MMAKRNNETKNEQINHMLLAALESGDFITAMPLIESISSNESLTLTFPSNNTPLHYACQHGRVDVARRLVTHYKYSIESKDNNGQTPLHTAAQYGHLDAFLYLLGKLFINIQIPLSQAKTLMLKLKLLHNHVDHNGNTPLHVASRHGNLALVRLLTHVYRCDPDSTNNEGMSCLHLAAEYGHLHVMRYLLEEAESDMSLVDEHGRSPSYLAAGGGHLDMLKYMIEEKGADPNFKTTKRWVFSEYTIEPGKSLVHTASHKGHLHVIRYLVDHQECDSSCLDENGITPLHLACMQEHMGIVEYLINELQCDPNYTSSKGMTCLHCASIDGNLNIMKYLIYEKHCDMNKDGNGNTPLHYAALHGKLEVVKFFIDDLNCDPNSRNQRKEIPLHLASKNGHLDVVKYLMDRHHCDPLFPDEDQVTPLHLASYNGHLDVVAYFTINHNSDLLIENILCKHKPLHYAAWNGKLDVVKFFIDALNHGPDSRGQRKRIPLHYASENGHLDVVKYLVDRHHCYPLFPDEDQVTPLHLASSNGHLEVVRYFTITHHCDPLVKDMYENRPLHYAAGNGKLDVVKFFIDDLDCDPDIKNKNKTTPLVKAISEGHEEVSEYLISLKQVNVLSSNSNGLTPVHFAVKKRNLKILNFISITRRIRLLSYFRSDFLYLLNLHQMSYIDPLHRAAIIGDMDAIRLYIEEEKWYPLLQDYEGNNPLHYAAYSGKLEVVKYLVSIKHEVKHGVNKVQCLCDPLLSNNLDQTAQEIASQRGHKHVESYLLRATTKQSIIKQDIISPIIDVFVVGNSGSGKSTLVKAVSQEKSILGRYIKVKGVVPLTAGIVPTTVDSESFGTVNIYDFAGHEEYYASNEMILHQSSHPLVLIAVNIALPPPEVEKQILYWLALLDCTTSETCKTMHVMIIGSHADLDSNVTNNGEKISALVKSKIIHHTSITYHGLINCDCRYSGSREMDQLRHKLNDISKIIRISITHSESDHSNRLCASLMYYIRNGMSNPTTTITIRKLSEQISELESPGPTLAQLTDQNMLIETCKQLWFSGHLFFLPHEHNKEKSLLVIDNETVLSIVHASFKEIKKKISNDFGMLEESSLKIILSSLLNQVMDPGQAITYLKMSQFCTEITPDQLLSVPDKSNGENYYFFPNLVHATERPAPTTLWKTEADGYTQLYTWSLECTISGQFFTPRYIHTLFIQLMKCESDSEHMECIIWKNGILMVHSNLTRCVIELNNQTTQLYLALQSENLYRMNLVKQRSLMISLIKSLKKKLCSKLEFEEFLFSPQYSYPPVTGSDKICTTSIARSILDGHPAVATRKDGTNLKHVYISELLYFDLFHSINNLFDRDILHKIITSKDIVPSFTMKSVCSAVEPHIKLMEAFRNKSGNGGDVKEITFGELYGELLKYTIFTASDLSKLASSELPEVDVKKSCPTTLQLPDITGVAAEHEEPDISISTGNVTSDVTCPNISNLILMRWKDDQEKSQEIKIIEEISNKWIMMGDLLGIKRAKLDSYKTEHQNKSEYCCREVFLYWLDGKGSPRYPVTWDGLNTLLVDIERDALAERLSEALQIML